MSKYTVHQGEGYHATLRCGFVQGWANNETDRRLHPQSWLCRGEGDRAPGEGVKRPELWPLPDATAEVPD